MSLRLLDDAETKELYNKIVDAGIEPTNVDYYKKSTEFTYIFEGKTYRLVYDRAGEWFSDMIFEVKD